MPSSHAVGAAVAVAVTLADAVLHWGVVTRARYTEIDYSTYCQQVALVSDGERDYTALRGDTGPCPYPAGFVWVYSALCSVADGTLGVESLAPVQAMFAVLGVATTAVAAGVTVAGLADKIGHRRSTLAAAAEWAVVLGLLVASYRMHSIFGLRLFNDPIAMFPVYLAVAAAAAAAPDALTMVLFSLGVSVKMNALLFAPGFGFLLLRRRGLLGSIVPLAAAAAVQIGLAWPFLAHNAVGYIGRAFNLGRVFMYKWTVNLKFLPEPTFVSKSTAMTLLAGHVTILAAFWVIRWMRADGAAGLVALLRKPSSSTSARPLSAAFVVRVLFVSNFIGIVFARTLHYQFYSWYFHTLPFLLWSTRLPLLVKLAVFGAIETAFNVFPATAASSAALTAAHAVLLVALFVSPLEPARSAPPRAANPAAVGLDSGRRAAAH